MENIKGSETYFTALALTLCGGYLDAYTYFCRGGVFANAQTGNIIKLGLQIAEGNYIGCIRFLIPIISFSIAIFFSLSISYHLKKRNIPFVKRAVLLVEILILFIVSLIPAQEELNIIANTLVSFTCAMQMQIFSKFEIGVTVTTVSTGNLRKALENGFYGFVEHDERKKKLAFKYLMVVGIFIFGVIIGTLITEYLGIHSILVVCFLLFVVFLWITFRYIKDHH